MSSIKATVSPDFNGTWSGECEGRRFTICKDMAEELLGLNADHEYKITVKNKKPKKWRTSLLLESEPVNGGNIIFVRKRHICERLDPDLAGVFYDQFFFGKNNRLKIWVKVKKIDE